jgi:hypothetical protein
LGWRFRHQSRQPAGADIAGDGGNGPGWKSEFDLVGARDPKGASRGRARLDGQTLGHEQGPHSS